MKNTAIKIVILVGLLVLVIGAVLIFLPTIITPPSDVPIINTHKHTIEKGIASLSEHKPIVFNDSTYDQIVSKMRLYRTEEFLTEEELDEQTVSLVEEYFPIFRDYCYNCFNNSVWNESDHKAILIKANHMRSLRIKNNKKSPLTNFQTSEINKIQNIIEQYRQAKQISGYRTFISIDDANKKIELAEQYANKEYIRNCTDLVYKLAEVKTNIGNSHYKKVENIVNEMSDYEYMEKDDFLSLVDIVDDKINEYSNNSGKYGSAVNSVSALKNKATEYYRDAMEYYKRSSIVSNVNLDIDYGWATMDYPNSSYKAYQSNYGYDNRKYTMSFQISGRTQYEFYVRSCGEANYDYLMVGLDYKPTENNNNFNTKGNSKCGNSFSDYLPVRFNNLSSNKTYTIYVTYRKDGSNSTYSDKGYVLIPQ